MTKAEKVKRARRWVRDMQKLLPCALRVYVSAKDVGPGARGTCNKTKRGFELRLDWDVEWWVLDEFLLPHEYAHARVWGRLQAGTKDHDGHFWLEVGVVDAESHENLS